MKTNQVREINEREFEAEVLRCPQTVLGGFLAAWSKPCHLVEPIPGEVAEVCNGKAKILKVNVDDNPGLGPIYEVQSIPMLIFSSTVPSTEKSSARPAPRQFSPN